MEKAQKKKVFLWDIILFDGLHVLMESKSLSIIVGLPMEFFIVEIT